MVDDALEAQDPRTLYHLLQDPILALKSLRRDNASWYLDQLSADREEKALVGPRAAEREGGLLLGWGFSGLHSSCHEERLPLRKGRWMLGWSCL